MRGYYYCSLNTFLNILKNKQIYLSDPLKMNDTLEIKWYLEKLNNEDRTFSMLDFDVAESLIERVKARSYIDFTLEEFMEILDSKGQSSVYISCFSKEPDILSQWRAYAEDGKGVSIGFNLDNLCTSSNIFFEKVTYTDSVVYNDGENNLEIIADQIGTVLDINNITKKEEQVEVFLHELIQEFVKYKNPAFIEEKEVRLVYCDDMKFEEIVNSKGAFLEPWKSVKLEHDFRITGNADITEFVKLDYDPLAIEEICIGPKCSLSEQDVKNIVYKLLGTDVSVRTSKSSYR